MRKLYSTLLFICMSVVFANAQYTWVNKSLFPDSGFLGGASFVINGKGYIAGREVNRSPTFSSQTWEYSPGSDSWTQKRSCPGRIGFGASFADAGVGYVVGGYNDSTGFYESSCFAYDPVADIWSSRLSFPESGYGGGYYFTINGIAYVGSGARNTNVHGVASGYAYNIAGNTWSSIADFPKPGIGLCTFVIDSFGYAGMGGDGNGNFFNEMYKYNPRTNSWSQIASFPGAARFVDFSSFVMNGMAFVGAGQKTLGAGGTYCLGDYYRYDPSTNLWEPAPGLQGAPRYAADAFSFGDSAYLVGGFNQDGGTFYRFVDEFKPAGVICSVTDTNYITDTTHISVTDTLYISVSVGIAPNTTNNTLSVYPNPAHTQLVINSGNYASMNGYSLKIVNATGQTVFQNADNQQLFNIAVSSWAPGIYYLQVINASSVVVATKEIVIQ